MTRTPVKISIAISLLILAAAAVLGWSDQQRLTAMRAGHAKLVAEAALLGITLDPAAAGGPVRSTKRGRADREAEARAAAVEIIAFAREMEEMQQKGGTPDEATRKRWLNFMERMMSLDAAHLKILIAELRGAKDLKDETFRGLIGFSIMTLANDHPQAAIAIFTESADLLKESGMGNQVISSALTHWAKDDPLAAVEWVRANGTKFPELVNDDAKRGIISGTAVNDPKLAFKLIGELGLKDPSQAVSNIMKAAVTAEMRNASLAALREYAAASPDEVIRDRTVSDALSGMTYQLTREGFIAATRWLDSAGLSEKELEGFVSGGLAGSNRYEETGKWIEWSGEKLPEPSGTISQLVRQWTRNDFQAAGKWLATTPDGPTKNVSIRAYAETVSQYEPETAAQWAMTLPPGKDREQTLRNIHGKWPKEDAAAREAFAKEHGIGK